MSQRWRIETLRPWVAAAQRGDFRGVVAAIGGGDLDAASQATLASLCWFADLAPHRLPALEDLRALEAAAPPTRRVAIVAAALRSRACLIAFDQDGLHAAAACLRALAEGLDDPEVALVAALGTLRAAIGEGAPGCATRAQTLAAEARALGVADVLVEATTLRALALGTDGARREALDTARRAVRMAQTEGLRQEQYLAGLALARTRRLVGQAHLASHVLRTLARCASRPWRPWIAWEMVFASGAAEAEGPAEAVASSLGSLEHHGGAALEVAEARLGASVGRFGLAAADWRRLRGLFALDLPRDDPAILAFRTGATHAAPHGLGALLGEEAPRVFVVAGLEGPPRRVARALVTTVVPAARVARATQRQQRAFTLLATVALAGAEGLDEPTAFREVYGFAYQRDLHRDVFNVLVHRARAALGELGTLDRADGRFWLRAEAPLALPDPRCARPLDDRVLSLVSTRGRLAAREISSSLGVSLRSAQKALEVLVDDGACVRDKEGRHVAYSVEDTTFSEPTDHALVVG